MQSCSWPLCSSALSPRGSDASGCLEPYVRVGWSLLWGEALGAATLVGAVGVVDVGLADQVALQAGVLGRQGEGEGRLPTLLEQSLLDALHAAVGGGAAGARRRRG